MKHDLPEEFEFVLHRQERDSTHNFYTEDTLLRLAESSVGMKVESRALGGPAVGYVIVRSDLRDGSVYCTVKGIR